MGAGAGTNEGRGFGERVGVGEGEDGGNGSRRCGCTTKDSCIQRPRAWACYAIDAILDGSGAVEF